MLRQQTVFAGSVTDLFPGATDLPDILWPAEALVAASHLDCISHHLWLM